MNDKELFWKRVKKGLLDIIKRDEAELNGLRGIAERAEDVDGTARILHETEFSTDFDSITGTGREECLRIGRAVATYLKEGK